MKEARSSNENSDNNLFADLAQKISSSFSNSDIKAPQIRLSVLEKYSDMMSRFGYEMSELSVKILCDYLKGYNIWLCGNVGVGKTFFFDTISRIRTSQNMDPIIKLSMIETQGWTMEKAAEWSRDFSSRDVLIDDVGAEPLLNHYGEKIEVFPYLLEKRLNIRNKRTHLTSNLGPSDILKRYDRRVADRFAQMFKMIEIKSKKSRRRLSPWKVSNNGAGVL